MIDIPVIGVTRPNERLGATLPHMELDPRGQRFAAALTSIVLVIVLLTGWGWLALAQTLVFAITAWDPRKGPYGFVYRALVLPRIGPPAAFT